MIEDDFGVTSAELVWEAGKDRGKKPITLGEPPSARAQGKLMWDIAEVQVPSGGDVRYWIEAKDNDTDRRAERRQVARVSPARDLAARAPRRDARRQQEVAEKLLKNLGGRLVGPGDDIAARDELVAQLRDAIVELALGQRRVREGSARVGSAAQVARRRCAIASTSSRRTEQKLLPKGATEAQTRHVRA